MGTGKDLLERRKFTFVTSEDLGDLERLRYETLDLTGTLDLEVYDGTRDRIKILTVSLSSSGISSIPRMAMIS